MKYYSIWISLLNRVILCQHIFKIFKNKILELIEILPGILNYYKQLFSQLCRTFFILSGPFIYPTNAQLDCSKRMLKFTLKVLLHV
jgi:hypothetical protein